MKINLRRHDDNQHPKPMFLRMSQFNTIAFAGRVRQLRLPQAMKKSPPICSSKNVTRTDLKLKTPSYYE
jgi:hypothetical protein